MNGDKVLVFILLVAGLGLFLTGFRFLNPLDTIFRLCFGGMIVTGSLSYLKYHRA
jgi:hypothetical protein